MKEVVQVKAPAKVNLILKVLGRLANGYHEIWSVMQSVDLYDHLEFCKLTSSRNIRLVCDADRTPQGKENIVYRAAERVLEKAKLERGVEIRLKKQIPMAAGLGGGSSDAASTIFGMVQLFDLKWSLSEMASLGAGLGSDVSFFFFMPHALIRGIGERVDPITIKGAQWILLVNPGFPIETRWAYQKLAKSRAQVHVLPQKFMAIDIQEPLDFLDVLTLMENDFESALFPEFPFLQEIKTHIGFLGADIALLSGSGSTVFGVFSQEELARNAMHAVEQDLSVQAFCIPAGSRGLTFMEG